MKVNIPHYEVNVPHYDIKPPKIYHIKKNQIVPLFILSAIILAVAAEVLALMSDHTSSYTIENLITLMTLTEIAIFILIAVYILSFYLKGRINLILIDAARFAAVVLLCISLYYVLSDRATLMGYVWFSDLASGNADAVLALNYGVISAALYIATIIVLAVSCGWDIIPANKVKRTPEIVKAEIAALQKELVELEGGDADTQNEQPATDKQPEQ